MSFNFGAFLLVMGIGMFLMAGVAIIGRSDEGKSPGVWLKVLVLSLALLALATGFLSS